MVPLYKDAPSYLTDVSFFFRGATFSYAVQGADVLTNASGQTYFRVTANRTLTGMTVNGDSVNWNKVRYIEINYSDSLQQLNALVDLLLNYNRFMESKTSIKPMIKVPEPEENKQAGVGPTGAAE